MIKIEKIISFNMNQNCYLVYNEERKDAILIDPGEDSEKILKKIKSLGLLVTHILLTHCHYDHIMSVNKFREDVKVVASKNCSENITQTNINLSLVTSNPFTLGKADIILEDMQKVNLCGMEFTAIETPGHTNCGMCYLFGDVLFSGDTLFKRTIGRTDLPTSSYEELENSIKNKLFMLGDDITVMCGHGDDTTIGYEKKFNLAL